MVTYWDSSALIPLVLREPTSQQYRGIAGAVEISTWWGSYVECVSAIVRHSRSGTTAPAQIAESYRMLEALSHQWSEVDANDQLRRAAVRAAREHDLRAADALQLGAAIVASNFDPSSTRFIAEDRQLRRAAEAEGFVVD